MSEMMHKQVFGDCKQASLDMSQLIIAGHGFGGHCAFITAQRLGYHKVKALIMYDGQL
jgi:acetyl esterase/lipase